MKWPWLATAVLVSACDGWPGVEVADLRPGATTPNDGGASAVDGAHPASVPPAWADKSNPFGYDDPQVGANGKAGYVSHCASCHGIDGHGHDGAAPDLHKANLQHADAFWFWRIDAGAGQMPAFGDTLDDEAIWRIITYARWNFTQF